MHPRAVELGEVYGMPILVRSSFSDAPGHADHAEENVEIRKNVRGIAHDTDVAKISHRRRAGPPGHRRCHLHAARRRRHQRRHDRPEHQPGRQDRPLVHRQPRRPARAAALVETIVPEHRRDGPGSLRGPGQGLDRRDGHAERAGLRRADVPGAGAGGINIDMITTSDIRITCIIAASQADEAVNALHAAFELDQE